MDQTVSWFAMPIGVQISNVGSEVHRAIRWKNRGDEQKRNSFCPKAIKFLELIMLLPWEGKKRRKTDGMHYFLPIIWHGIKEVLDLQTYNNR